MAIMNSRKLLASVATVSAMTGLVACSSSDDASTVRPTATSTSQPSDSVNTDDTTAECPVTQADPIGTLPPGLTREKERIWHGSGPIWIDLGNFTTSVQKQDGVFRVKYAWWTGDENGQSVKAGPPEVSAEPFDGGQKITATHGGYASAQADDVTFAWWPTTLDFPTGGCWKITGTLDGVSVESIVDITEAPVG